MSYLTNNVKGITHFDEKLKSVLLQCLITFGIAIIIVSSAMAEGYSAVLLPQLEESNEWELDDNTASWISSITALPMPIGCVVSGILMEKIGRKPTILLTEAILVFGWILIYFCQSMTVLMIGRFLTGITMGLISPVGGPYVAETSDPKYRGFLISFLTSASCIGVLLSHVIGSFVNWRITALISAVISLPGLVLVFTPESPTYLVNIGQVDKATRSFYACRSRSESSKAELVELIQRQHEFKERNSGFNFRLIISDIMKPEFYKPMMIITVFFWASQWSGNNAITFYCVLIIRQTVGSGIDNFLAMVVIDILRVIMSVMACFFCKLFSRRFIVLSTGFCMTACLFLTTVYMFVSKYYSLESYSYVPLIGLVGYVSFLSIGFMPISWVMVGEVFPQSHRGLGSGMAAFTCFVWMFSVVKTVPFMISDWGIDTTFLIYALSGLLGTVILCVVLPETKDKPLHEIEDRFKKKRMVIP